MPESRTRPDEDCKREKLDFAWRKKEVCQEALVEENVGARCIGTGG